uniref:interferon-induced transmembrane protein 3-like n=1 Tax=Centroberyx gerrardi TaxID=166262 RepID=UPI003AAD1E77
MKLTALQPSAFVPVKENKCDVLLVETGSPAVVQHTTVRIDRTEPLPRDHIVWSLCSLLYGNPFCLGLAALCYSVKARDRKLLGDLEGARKQGSTALCLNIFALVLVVTMIILFFVMLYLEDILFY